MTLDELTCATTPVRGEPVRVDFDAIAEADGDARDTRRRLEREGLVPAELRVTVSFDDPKTIPVQRECERVREAIRAADELSAGRVVVEVQSVGEVSSAADEGLRACRERAERAGLTLSTNRIRQ